MFCMLALLQRPWPSGYMVGLSTERSWVRFPWASFFGPPTFFGLPTLALPLQKCLLRRRDTRTKNRDPEIISERYQIIAGSACSSTRPTCEDKMVLLFSFLLYTCIFPVINILRDPPKKKGGRVSVTLVAPLCCEAGVPTGTVVGWWMGHQ